MKNNRVEEIKKTDCEKEGRARKDGGRAVFCWREF